VFNLLSHELTKKKQKIIIKYHTIAIKSLELLKNNHRWVLLNHKRLILKLKISTFTLKTTNY